MDTDQTNDDVADSTTDQVDESPAEKEAQPNQRQAPAGHQFKKKSSAGPVRDYDQRRGPAKFQRHQRFKRIDPKRNNFVQNETPRNNYNSIQAEMYGSGCKGKKFRKEKGKKKLANIRAPLLMGLFVVCD